MRDRKRLLDGLGNFATFQEDSDGQGWDLEQERDVNAANEITGIDEGQYQDAWITPEYDAAGNMISGPAPGDETARLHFVYDAWNRLVKVYADDAQNPGEPGDVVAQYTYDGQKRRIEKTLADGTSIESYYNAGWQLLEERFLDESHEPTGADQYVWSPRYIDAPILRDRYDESEQLDADARLYYLGDANFNVTALVGLDDEEWTVTERYAYDPYGKAVVYDADWDNPTAPTAAGPLFAGYMFDAETGLHLARHRLYHSTIATWITRDPLEVDANLYRYCRNLPSRRTDPLGLADQDAKNMAIEAAKKLGAEFLASEEGAEWFFRSMQWVDGVYNSALAHTTGFVHDALGALGRDGRVSDRIIELVDRKIAPNWQNVDSILMPLYAELLNQNPGAAERLSRDPQMAQTIRSWNETLKQTEQDFIRNVAEQFSAAGEPASRDGMFSREVEIAGAKFKAVFDIDDFDVKNLKACGTLVASLTADKEYSSSGGLMGGKLTANATIKIPFEGLHLGQAAAAQGEGHTTGTPALLAASITARQRLELESVAGQRRSIEIRPQVLWEYSHLGGAWQPTMSIGLAHRSQNQASQLAVYAEATARPNEGWRSTIQASFKHDVAAPKLGEVGNWLQRAFPAQISVAVSAGYFKEHRPDGEQGYEAGVYLIIGR